MSGTILVSVSEIIALYLGVATMASVYSLYWVCSDGKATFWQNMAFSVLASLTSSGYGMHAACVVAQLQMAPDNPLYSLLDFVHERWSHYMFQCGIFSLLLLIVWTERADPSLSTSQDHREESKKLPLLVGVWLKWLGPILVGLFTAIFSNRTETGGICLTFYVSVIVSCFLFNRYYSFNFLDVLFGKSKYVALSFFVTASLYGVPTVFIHSWLM